MRRLSTAALSIFVLVALPAMAGTEIETLREARWVTIEPGQSMPEDLTNPEGRSRWDLTSLEPGAGWVRTFSADPAVSGRVLRMDRGIEDATTPGETRTYADPSGGRGAEYWLLPDRYPSLMDSRKSDRLLLHEINGDRTERLWIETRRVGVGWLHLPEGDHEVILQWAVVYREPADGGDFVPETVLHRWVDPREGLVAEVWGPASGDGLSRLEVTGAAVVEETLSGKQVLRVYANDLDRAPYTRLAYGYDRGDGVAVSSLTPDAHTTIGDLVAAGAWDFSGNNSTNSTAEIASGSVEVNSDETCSWNQCGFTVPGAKLGREDKNFDDPANADITTTVQQREDRAADVTIWLRAGVNKEGQTGGLGDGESRLCYVDGGRTDVPLWRFTHYDALADDYYFEDGDTWTHTPFACENVIFNHVCPSSCGFGCPIYAKACNDFSGTLSSAVVNEGPVTLPSGHTFQATLVRSVAEFCVYLGSTCLIKVNDVRTVTYLWEVPQLGTVARLVSSQVAPDYTSFTTLAETDIKYGIFPPLSITAGNATETTLDISWNPGTETGRITAYKIYWDTDSGSVTDYANSVIQPVASGTTATIGALQKGTEYFVTVTALSDYANPASQTPRTYESVRYPTTVPASPNPLPVEVSATTNCLPTDEVSGVVLNKVGGDIEICWTDATDACLGGYQILDSATPQRPGDFALLHEVPSASQCRVVTAAELDTFIQVQIKGFGGNGP